MTKTQIPTFLLLFASLIFTHYATAGSSSVPRIYLASKVTGETLSLNNRITATRSVFYGFDPDFVDIRVTFFGRNIAKDLEPVPEAHKIMNGYLWHGIGSIVLVAGGLGIFAGSIPGLFEKSNPKPDGTYDTSVPSGLPIGLSLMGTGLIVHWTKDIYLHCAVKSYNKHAGR